MSNILIYKLSVFLEYIVKRSTRVRVHHNQRCVCLNVIIIMGHLTKNIINSRAYEKPEPTV